MIRAGLCAVAGNITSFYDPAVLALNPFLASVLDGQPAPITFVFGCLLSTAGSPVFSAIVNALYQLLFVDPSIIAAVELLGSKEYEYAVYTCSQMPGVRWLYAQSEQLIPALVDNVVGSIG